MEKNFALVLGGGGAAGNAWLIGVCAGLAEQGLDVARLADAIYGTSAGATAAAQLRGGPSIAELYAATQAPPAAPAGPGGGRAAGGPNGPDGRQHSGTGPGGDPRAVFERMRAIGAAASSALDVSRGMGAFALESDPSLAPRAAARLAQVASRLPSQQWPERYVGIAAVDALSGELVVLDRECGASLAEAVAASTSLPGGTASVPIAGRRYVDGGVFSADNAQLGSGFERVIVLSPLTRPEESAAPRQFEGLRREDAWGTTLGSQVAALRSGGSVVTVIHPDDEALAVFGANLTSTGIRPAAAREGYRQGRAADVGR
ncbi:MAG: patatin-like phospholipase family protein [Arthrobacter sp.]|jgi:NTE family protein|nr:patatin-like phospholipase family protein [Arthrobacter sp.]